MIEQALISKYKKDRKNKKSLVDLEASSLAGYYLSIYAGEPIEALILDVENVRVSNIVGQAAKVILQVVLNNGDNKIRR